MDKIYKWEDLDSDDTNSTTERMKVPGGWLIRCTEIGQENFAVSVTFYPDPSRLWS